jgi:hypothetical protein
MNGAGIMMPAQHQLWFIAPAAQTSELLLTPSSHQQLGLCCAAAAPVKH